MIPDYLELDISNFFQYGTLCKDICQEYLDFYKTKADKKFVGQMNGRLALLEREWMNRQQPKIEILIIQK